MRNARVPISNRCALASAKVLDGILDGRLHKQLAAEIGVSERTIRSIARA